MQRDRIESGERQSGEA
jgi:hypothetical protein